MVFAQQRNIIYSPRLGFADIFYLPPSTERVYSPHTRVYVSYPYTYRMAMNRYCTPVFVVLLAADTVEYVFRRSLGVRCHLSGRM